MDGRSSRAAAPVAGSVSAPDPDGAAAPPSRPLRLKKRRDFLAAARGRKWTTPGFVLQARLRRADEPAEPKAVRVGFTASKKVGGAVARNRAKRRLRALAEPILGSSGQPGWDYVLIARAGETAHRPFETLKTELAEAIQRVHRPPKSGGGRSANRSRDKGAPAQPAQGGASVDVRGRP